MNDIGVCDDNLMSPMLVDVAKNYGSRLEVHLAVVHQGVRFSVDVSRRAYELRGLLN